MKIILKLSATLVELGPDELRGATIAEIRKEVTRALAAELRDRYGRNPTEKEFSENERERRINRGIESAWRLICARDQLSLARKLARGWIAWSNRP